MWLKVNMTNKNKSWTNIDNSKSNAKLKAFVILWETPSNATFLRERPEMGVSHSH